MAKMKHLPSVDEPLYQMNGKMDMLQQPGAGAAMLQQDMLPEFGAENVTMEDDGGATISMGGDEKQATDYDSLPHDANIAESMSESAKAKIAERVVHDYTADMTGREQWEEAFKKGIELLGLTIEERTQPFKGATGVQHPLLNEAVTQFQSGAYKELIPANGPVNAKIIGKATNELEQAAKRVKDYMNFQIMYIMEEFEPEYDQMLYYLGLNGSAFKKTYKDENLGRPVSRYVSGSDVIVPYSATDLKTATRITHRIQMTRNELLKAMASGFYSTFDLPEGGTVEIKVPSKDAIDKIEGRENSQLTTEDEPFTVLECHCEYDLNEYSDNETDSIKYPYICTVLKDTMEVLSIRKNWEEKDPKRIRKDYFTHYKFSPGLGFYGFGLIHLVGNLNRSATSILRQLIDAGTFANLPGGFKTKGLRVADDGELIQPGEWRDLDVPGGRLQDSIMPMPYKEPSATLFQLLGFVVGSAEKFVGTQEISIGDGRQEMPVGTTLALLERGSKVMSAVHKRLHSAFKTELKLLATLFAQDVPNYPYEVEGAQPQVKQEDFGPRVDIIPVSDPNIFSMAQRVVLAQEQLKMAQTAPQLHNLYEAFKRMYRALGIDGLDELLPPPKQPQPEDPAKENGKVPLILTGGAEPLKAFPNQDHESHTNAHISFMKTKIVRAQPAIYAVMLQHIYDHISLRAEAEARRQLGMPEQAMPTQEQPEDPTSQDPKLQLLVAKLAAQYIEAFAKVEETLMGGNDDSDPLVALKNRELDIKQQENLQEGIEKAQQLALDKQKQSQNIALGYEKMQSAEEIAADRIAQQKQDSEARIAQQDRALQVRRAQANRPRQ